MKEVFLFEQRRMFRSMTFRVSLLFVLLLVGWHFFDVIQVAFRYNWSVRNESMEAAAFLNVWDCWLGTDALYAESLLFFDSLLPVLAALPYAVSGWQDIKSGYRVQVCTRCDRKRYYIGKYLAVFNAGGIIIVSVLLLDLLVCHLCLPTTLSPSPIGKVLGPSAVGGSLFYTCPYLYAAIYMLIDYIFGGIYACLGLAATWLLRNTFLIFIFPYVFNIGLSYLGRVHKQLELIFISKACPAQPYGEGYYYSGLHFALNLGILLLLGIVVYFWKCRRRELYP